MKTLYFDCFSGISGDMTIGALLDLGLDFEYLKAELRKLPLDGYALQVSRVVRANISAMKFDVLMNKHEEEHHHHGSGHGPHSHRKASQILEMIRASGLNANAKRIADAIFTKLAISEGRVHRISPEDVEFHEVGAVDSIVDTVGAAIGFDALGIERFVCSPINVGGGFIHCQHGVYPVPAPATADLLKGATVYSKHVSAELVTPTGAAILAAVVTEFEPLNGVAIDGIGYGAGTREFQDFPNCLRVLVCGEPKAHRQSLSSRGEHAVPDANTITVIEANIDDMTPQNLAYVTERLLEAGALDVCTIPAFMKKGRPGHLLQVLSAPNRLEEIERVIFTETTTLGVRHYATHRSALEREFVTVKTELGEIRMKVAKLDGRVVNFAPEYEDCSRIARDRGIPLKEVQSAALQAYLARRS